MANSQSLTVGDRLIVGSAADGTCVIDIFHRDGAVSDSASAHQLKEAASSVMRTCVHEGQTRSGGYIRDVGKRTMYYPKTLRGNSTS